MQTDRQKPASGRRRLALLLGCLTAGAAVALVGSWLVPAQAWWLAVPAAVAISWLVVADPTRCERR